MGASINIPYWEIILKLSNPKSAENFLIQGSALIGVRHQFSGDLNMHQNSLFAPDSPIAALTAGLRL
jgi:hypothetical protein